MTTRERRGCCCGSPAGYVRGGSVRLCCRAGHGLCAVYGTGRAELLLFVFYIRLSIFSAQLYYFGNRL